MYIITADCAPNLGWPAAVVVIAFMALVGFCIWLANR